MAKAAIDDLPAYGAVYVVSDLHLGGFTEYGRDYRIFREAAALAWFIGEWLPAQAGGAGRVCLVLNGDIVDYLAHPTPHYFDWPHAVDKLRDAIGDPEQKIVWQALQTFVTGDAGDLVLVLGNHDLELALPDAQQALLSHLTNGRQALRGRVHLAMDGAGFACRVGDKRVLCLHGNEADPWNAIDYGRLSLIRRALARGSMQRNAAVLDGWVPAPGTQLVIEYLNAQKRKYQWIDLLKPEEEAVGMITAALCDLPSVRTFAEVMVQKLANTKRLADGFMAGSATPAEEAPIDAAASALPPVDASAAVARAIEALGRDISPEALVQEPADDTLMDPIELVGRTAQLKAWPRSLRDVLVRTLAGDRTFDIATPDGTFTALDDLVGPDADFLVAGHTHLQRACERRRYPGKYYFNSGTWIRLLSIPKELLAPDLFPALEARLRDGRLTELEKKVPASPGGVSLLRTTRTVVRIAADADQTVRGELQTVEPPSPSSGDNRPAGGPTALSPTPGGWQLVPVAGSCFPRRGGPA